MGSGKGVESVLALSRVQRGTAVVKGIREHRAAINVVEYIFIVLLKKVKVVLRRSSE